MNSDESEIRTVVRVQLPHKDDVTFARSEYLHSQLLTCDNKGKYKYMKSGINRSTQRTIIVYVNIS